MRGSPRLPKAIASSFFVSYGHPAPFKTLPRLHLGLFLGVFGACCLAEPAPAIAAAWLIDPLSGPSPSSQVSQTLAAVQPSEVAPTVAQVYSPPAPTAPAAPAPSLPGTPIRQQGPQEGPPAFPVPGQPISPLAPAPAEAAPGEEGAPEGAAPPPPVAPPPAAVPTAPVAPSTLRYLPLPPAFTFLRQDPTYSLYLEQNPLEPPQRVRFTLIGGAQYDSNRNLQTSQKASDISALGTLATTLNLPQPRYFLTLANAITYRHSLRTGTDSLDTVNLSLASGYSVSPRLSVGLTDLFVRADNRLQSFLNQPVGLFVSTKPAEINTVTASANYLLSPVSSLVFTLGNTIVRNEDPQLENSATGLAGLSFSTTLLPKLSLGGGYTFTHTVLSREPFLQTHSVNSFVGYSLDSVTRVIVGGFITARLRPGPDDSLVYGANFRVERRLFEGIVCYAGAGFTNVDTANQGVRRRYHPTIGCTGDGGLGGGTSALLAKNLTLDLDIRSQIRDTTDETVAVGLVSTETASATLRFFPNREFLGTLRLSASRSQLFETTFAVPNATRGNTFTVLQGDLSLNYKLTTWLSAIGNYSLARRLADRGTDFVIHRAFVGLSAGYGL